MSTSTLIGQVRPVIAAEQIQKRVKEMARQISDHYRGQTIHALAVLENGFMFMADLVRALECPVICTFIKPKYSTQVGNGPNGVLEIFFSHALDIRDQNVLLVEGLVHSGVTSEFLMSDLRSRARGFGEARSCSTASVHGGFNYSLTTWLSGGRCFFGRLRPRKSRTDWSQPAIIRLR